MVIDKLVDDLKAFDISKKEFKGGLYKSPETLLLKPTNIYESFQRKRNKRFVTTIKYL